MALEEAIQVTVDEASVRAPPRPCDLEALTRPLEGRAAAAAAVATTEPIDFPSWNVRRRSAALRRASLPTWILPLGRVFAS